ncbi:branched-chain amino acid aminotransferase II [Aspergillus ibericus CBS 121593]|uniref:Branched-chain-amino-acid aminotransferase n=1 Tax=Aspergillus ibericus CBS 121593 TaxID=1448316 RepID=A0A395GNF8_9EURO|nr:branched-chain amino acid aminotransferase II [Aspergillus ibericus CBS 121593]RAK96498.1 branched-chain amino acid aminotransferase II [Aspergillus ibericus CBS 121593]
MATSTQPLDASRLSIHLTTTPREVPIPGSKTATGCTDHMIIADWTTEAGWSTPQLVPYGPMEMMPSASVLHYSTSCFEGLKLYRGHDGNLRLFRPEANCARFLRSAQRISLPEFDPEQVQHLIRKLCEIDGPRWLPKIYPGRFLYLRPTMIGTDSSLGFHAPRAARLFIIICCWPTIQSADDTGMRLVVSTEGSVRAWPGGTGASKVGANYGPTVQAHVKATTAGFQQVLWVFGKDDQVTESGSSNLFTIWETTDGRVEIVTCPLENDLVLPGITRQSILALLRERLDVEGSALLGSVKPVTVAERSYTMGEIQAAARENRLLGAFAAGTAYFVTPVSYIDYRGEGIEVPVGKVPYVALLQEWLADIMYGKVESDWAEVVEEPTA